MSHQSPINNKPEDDFARLVDQAIFNHENRGGPLTDDSSYTTDTFLFTSDSEVVPTESAKIAYVTGPAALEGAVKEEIPHDTYCLAKIKFADADQTLISILDAHLKESAGYVKLKNSILSPEKTGWDNLTVAETVLNATRSQELRAHLEDDYKKALEAQLA